MWLKMLLQWLERQRVDAARQQVEALQAEREYHALQLRKAEYVTWYFPPPC